MTVAVTVIDTLGRFVAGASVVSGPNNANTDAGGQASLAVATGGERVISVTKTGFAEQFKVVNLPTGATTTVSLQAMLIARGAAQTIGSIEAGGSATGSQGVKVTFPPGALVDAAGRPVSGAIQMSMTPVDVSEIDIGAFPGLFEGIPAGGARQAIVSVGTSELVPEQGGQKLNLAAGKTADIELPLFVDRQQDGSLLVVGSTVPLWSLDTQSGLWKQEGNGTVVASAASPTGLALRATISHFSWWNGDFAAQQGTINLTVNVTGTTLPAGTRAIVTGSVVAGTGPGYSANAQVAVGTARQFQVAASSTTTRLTAQAQTPGAACSGSVDVAPPVNTNINVTLTMTCVTLDVRLTRPSGPTSTNSQTVLPFRIEVDGTPDSVELFVDQTSVAQFGPQFFYTGFWDSSTFAEGSYSLIPSAKKNGITFTGTPVTVVIDRTAPQITGFAPDVSTEVSQATVFTVDFNEAVLAAPFQLSDAIRLTVTPIGSTTAQPIAFTAALDANGTRLTVTAGATFPLGIASLSWGGVHDAAGNAITGTVAASWTVSRSSVLGADFEFKGQGTRLAFALSTTGVPHAAFQRADNGNVQLVRFDGSDFVRLGPAANERTFGTDLALAIDHSGAVFVAIEQMNAAGTGGEVSVRRYDGTANTWVTLVAPFQTGRPDLTTARPRLAIDAANRPIVSFVGGGGAFDLQAFRFDGTAWASLGAVAGFVFSGQELTIDGTGNPVIAYLQGFASSNAEALRVATFNGTTWISLGQLDAVSDATDHIGKMQIAIAPDGRPWVAWGKRVAASVSLAGFDGTAFVPLAIAPPLTTFNEVAALAFVNGDPVVAGSLGGGVDVRRFHSGAWEPAVTFITPTAGALTLIPDGSSVLVGEAEFASGQAFGRMTRVVFP